MILCLTWSYLWFYTSLTNKVRSTLWCFVLTLLRIISCILLLISPVYLTNNTLWAGSKTKRIWKAGQSYFLFNSNLPSLTFRRNCLFINCLYYPPLLGYYLDTINELEQLFSFLSQRHLWFQILENPRIFFHFFICMFI